MCSSIKVQKYLTLNQIQNKLFVGLNVRKKFVSLTKTLECHLWVEIQHMITAPFNNMQTQKFKAQSTNVFFHYHQSSVQQLPQHPTTLSAL